MISFIVTYFEYSSVGQIFLLAMAGIALAWATGLVRAWNGRLRLAAGSSGAGALAGFLLFFSVLALPRPWFGADGQGDGFGLIGLMALGLLAMLLSGAAIVIALAVHSLGRWFAERRPAG